MATPARGTTAQSYLDWQSRFVDRMSTLLPSLRRPSLKHVAEEWYQQADHLSPEDAAEIAATWWRPYR